MTDRFDRKTPPYLTQFELVTVLAHRAGQLDRGMCPAVDPRGETDSLRIAEMELRAERLSLVIQRDAPDGTLENWNVSDLINLHTQVLLPKPSAPPEEWILAH